MQNNDTDLNDINNFEVIYELCKYDKHFKINYFNMLELFFKETIDMYDGFFYFGDLKEERIINKDNFDEFIILLKEINCMVNKEDNESYGYRLDEIPGDIIRNDRSLTQIYKSGKIGGVPKL